MKFNKNMKFKLNDFVIAKPTNSHEFIGRVIETDEIRNEYLICDQDDDKFWFNEDELELDNI